MAGVMIKKVGEDRVVAKKLSDENIDVPAGPGGRISDVFGILERGGLPLLSIEDINRIARNGWAGR
jgi:hypothetical protein